MPSVKTLKERVKEKLGEKEWICDSCGKEVDVVSTYGMNWYCLDCEKEMRGE